MLYVADKNYLECILWYVQIPVLSQSKALGFELFDRYTLSNFKELFRVKSKRLRLVHSGPGGKACLHAEEGLSLRRSHKERSSRSFLSG